MGTDDVVKPDIHNLTANEMLEARMYSDEYEPLSIEEQIELGEHRLNILKRRQGVNALKCTACKRYVGPDHGPLCDKCIEERKVCALCSKTPGEFVCRVCINAGAPICDLCTRPCSGTTNKCEVCLKAEGKFTARNFRSEERTESGIPAGSSVLDTSNAGAQYNGPKFDLSSGQPRAVPVMTTRSV